MNNFSNKYKLNNMAMRTNNNVSPVVYSPSINRNTSGISLIAGLLTEEQVLSLYQDGMDGRYSATTEEFGEEIFIISYYKGYFKRITGEYDYILNTSTLEWEVVSGSANTNSVTLTSNTPLIINASIGQSVDINFFYKSSLDIDGTAKIIIGTNVKEEFTVKSNANKIKNITKYIAPGVTTNLILEVTDTNSTKRLNYTITSVQITLNSTFDDTTEYISGTQLIIPYTISGPGQKNVIFKLGEEEKDITTNLNGGTNTFTEFTVNNHGDHVLTIQAYKELETTTVYSEEKRFSVMCVEMGNNTPIISSRFDQNQTFKLGTPINIDYAVYDPTNTNPNLNIYINDSLVTTVQAPRRTRGYYPITNYTPVEGKISIKLETSNVIKEFEVNIDESGLSIDHISGASLVLTAAGRSNNEDENIRNKWYDGNQEIGTLTNFSWGENNGWITDENGIPILRINGASKVNINYFPFSSQNFIVTSGMTIELDFKTNYVVDFEKVLIECFGNNIGFKIFGNECMIKSFLSTPENNIKYKEMERIKVSFVIGNTNQKIIRIYVNGVLSGLTSYLTDPTDTFEQNEDFKTPIKINDNGGGNIDLYSIRIYKRPLTHNEIVTNYIADLPIEQQQDIYNANLIYDTIDEEENGILSGGTVSFEKIQELIPTMLFTKGTSDKLLPTNKDEVTNVKISFIHPTESNLGFENLLASLKWQGTSSLSYVRKNYTFELLDTVYSLYTNAVPEKIFTLKADYMESSHSHNTGCAKLINTISPDFDHEDQTGDVRNAIYGYPIALFVQEEENGIKEFYGIYNFNNDRYNSDTFGLKEGSQAWELEDNLYDLCLFNPQKDQNGNYDFSSIDNDFKNLYKKNTDYTKLKELITWVADTDDIQTFRDEFEEHFNLDYCLFYHNMAYVLGAGDSLAKNMRLEYLPFKINEERVYRWAPRWYDIDSVLGLENKGHLMFDPYIEMDSTYGVNNTPVYNGKNSLLWQKFEQAFAEEIEENYRSLRNRPVNALSYELFEKFLKEEQIDKISMTMYNEDSDFKYIAPEKKEWYFVAQGTRLSHFQWWIDQRLKYLDSKYQYGEYEEDYVNLTLNQPENAAVTPSPNITLTSIDPKYLAVDYDQTILKLKFNKGETKTFIPELVNFNNATTRIYGVSSISDFGDLSKLYLSNFSFNAPSKIHNLTLGNSTTGYRNDALTTLSLEDKCPLLENINIRNCTGLIGTLDLSGCPALKNLDARGTNISSVQLINGSYIESLQLPSSISIINLQNQPVLRNLTLEGYEKLETLIVKNVPNINVVSIIQSSPNLSRVEINNVNWTITSDAINMMEKLRKIKADLRGKITVSSIVQPIPSQIVNLWEKAFPNVIFEGDLNVTGYNATFLDSNGNVLYTTYIYEGGNVTYNGSSVTKESDEYDYTFMRWAPSLNNIQKDTIFTPVFFSNKPTTFEIQAYNSTRTPSISIVGFRSNDISVEWGDGTATTSNDYNVSIQKSTPYANEGIYKIKIDVNKYSNWTENARLELNYTSSTVLAVLSWDPQDGIYGTLTNDIFTISSNNKIDTLNIPQGVIKVETLNLQKIRNISIPMSVQNISIDIFNKDFETITVSPLNNYLMEQDGVLYNKNQTNLYRSTVNKTSVLIPKTVTTIWSSSFKNCINLIDIDIPDSVTSIGNLAFSGCSSLTNIEIPDSVTHIGTDAFRGCSSLTSIVIPSSVTNIQTSTFSGCSRLTSITIPSSVTSIGSLAFNDCLIRNVYYQGTTESWCNIAFESSSSNPLYRGSSLYMKDENDNWYEITNFEIPDTIEVITKNKFYGFTHLQSITIPNSIIEIEEYAFRDCNNLTNVYYKGTMEDWYNVEINSYYANPMYYAEHFYMLDDNDEWYEVTNLEIPDGATLIDEKFNFRNLASITIPSSVVEISSNAFNNCENLTNVYYKGTIENWCNIKFGGAVANPMYYAEHFYMLDDNDEWYEVTEIMIPDIITAIGNCQFYGFDNVTSITIPNSVTSIGNIAFYGCNSLKNVVIGNNVINIGNSAFYKCGNLENIEIPDSVETIGQEIFYECSSLTTIKFSNKLERIPYQAFCLCRSLTSITIPNSVTSIGEDAFMGCHNLTNIIFGNGLTLIGENAFNNCRKITNVDLPGSLLTINDFAFSSCDKLERVYIPNSVTTMGMYINENSRIVNFYCESSSKPGGWSTNWIMYNRPVYWGVKRNYTVTFNSNGGSNVANQIVPYYTAVPKPTDPTKAGYVFTGWVYNGALYDFNTLVSNDITLEATWDAMTEGLEFEEEGTGYKVIGYNGSSSEVFIPSVYNNKTVTKIDVEAFYLNTNIQTVHIAPSIEVIDELAFAYCSNLTNVYLGTIEGNAINSNIKTVGTQAFVECDKLTSIILPSTITSMGSEALYTNGNLTIYYEDGINTTNYSGNWYNSEKTTLEKWTPEV